MAGRIGRRGLQKLGDTELVGTAAAFASRRRHLAYLRRHVIEHLGEFDPRLAVDTAMMRLAVESDLSVLEAFDDVHLPQRATAIEQRGVQPRDQRIKLLRSP